MEKEAPEKVDEEHESKKKEVAKGATKINNERLRFGIFTRSSEEWLTMASELNNEVEAARAEFNDTENKHNAIMQKLQSKTQICVEVGKELEVLRQEKKELEEEIRDQQAAAHTAAKNLQDCKTSKGKNKEDKQKEQETLTNEVNASKKDLASKRKALNDCQQQIAKLQEDLRNTDVDRLDAEATIHVWAPKLIAHRSKLLCAMDRFTNSFNSQ